jgi:arabinosaccharide transport system substrate-binding protein
MKQMLWGIIVVGVVVGSVGVGGGHREAATIRATPMTFWTFTGAEPFKLFFEAAARAWNAAYPDRLIALTCQIYPYEDMHTRLLMALKTGKGAPDLSDIEINKFPNFIRKGDQIHLIPLNDLIEPVQEKCVQARLTNYAKDGQYYGVDYHVGATVMYYNQELLAQAGVDVNTIEMWTDFVNAGKRVVAKTGHVMTTVETLDTWTQWPLISQRGSDFLDQDGKPTLDDAVNISTLVQ